ncbi:uncharacterized protein EV420DRAFT_1650042 [Desarmillaria tabescens]|uniref:Uncharacterized protein n=1 Tax=Armillaria tabescens TaxID=1929756 RepID=A0AA39JGA2_ARMTA|nr:uncharacterized protein EV420DRAFT_1650042 [Desarmillaria tabescens]KAK0441537.1 hypothetical protein EV420DRAFT_1650042 [Desarmillaria tabescens]
MVWAEELTPENIRKNPKLLLHKSAPDKRRFLIHPGGRRDLAFQARQFNNGFRGAVLPNSNFFLMSPNCGMLWEPPLGLNREVYMRRDYKYGKDDPLSWPQLYCPEYPHFACIRTPPWNSSPSDLFYPLFAPVNHSIFSPCAECSIVPNIGKLAGVYLEKLKAACIDIMRAARRIDRPDSLRLQIRLDCNMIDLFLARLDALPMNFERVCLTVAETQRVTCLLCALVDYIQIYKPRMDGLVERDPKVHDPMIMGAFVEDAMMLQHFFCARILVWTMQPLEEAAVYRIDVLTDIETPDSWLVLNQPRLKLRSVYNGAPNKAKYTAMNLFTRDHLGWANPFRLPSPVILTRPNAPLAVSTREDVRFSPYHNRSRSGCNKVPQSRYNVSGLTDPRHADLPPMVPVWRDALFQIDADKSRCHSSANVVRINGLSFPRVDLFTSIENVDKRAVGYWRGKEFGTLTANDKKEILWEISEMGFRLEVHALDQHASVANVNEEARKADIG